MNTEHYMLNLGPQHPSTHGVLRVLAEMDGETCVSSDVRIGYLHRGIEKLLESRTFQQGIPYTDRLDYLASLSNNLTYCMAVEKLAGIEVPLRAQYIRMITAEMMRIASYMVGIGCYIMDLGAVSAVFYPFQQREYILDALCELCGSRMTHNYIRIGGVAADLNEKFYEKLRVFQEEFPKFLKMYHKLLDENEIFRARTKGVGVITKEQAMSFGLSGPNLRASGVPYDLRKDKPYLQYGKYEFRVPSGQNGDCYDRYYVRMIEVEESFHLIRRFLDDLPEGEIMAKVPRVLKPEPGEAYVQTENPKGILGCFVASDGTVNSYRTHFRRPSYCNIAIYDTLFPGCKVADMVSIIASFDIVLGEIDA